MKLEQIIDICKEVQTRPGYKIETSAVTNGQLEIVFHLPVLIDANTGNLAPENASVMLRKNVSTEYVENWRLEDVLGFIYSQFIVLETHEQKEFLKYKGKRFLDPHPERGEYEVFWL